MASAIKSKYALIEKKRISESAREILQEIVDATDNFKKVSPSLRKEFNTFYKKLKTAKPEAIRGTKEYKEYGTEGASKPAATPEPSKALKEAIQKSREARKLQGLSTKKSDIDKDAGRPALKPGRRKSKTTGKTYYEFRENRIDRRPGKYPKLAEGGRVIDDVEMYLMIHGYYPESVMAMRGDGMALGIVKGDRTKFELTSEDAKIADEMGYEFDYEEKRWVEKDDDEYADGGGVGQQHLFDGYMTEEHRAEGGGQYAAGGEIHDKLMDYEVDIYIQGKDGVFFSHKVDKPKTTLNQLKSEIKGALSNDKLGSRAEIYAVNYVGVINRDGEFTAGKTGRELGFAFGGRPKSALMRDRAYQSNESWEKNYKRASKPKHPKYNR